MLVNGILGDILLFCIISLFWNWSAEIAIVHNTHLSCQTVLKFSTAHDNIILCKANIGLLRKRYKHSRSVQILGIGNMKCISNITKTLCVAADGEQSGKNHLLVTVCIWLPPQDQIIWYKRPYRYYSKCCSTLAAMSLDTTMLADKVVFPPAS